MTSVPGRGKPVENTSVPLNAAYAICARVARRHYENFPVASRLLPARMRPHVAAIYAFARVADDFADEGTRPEAERLALLDDWRNRLEAATTGRLPADTGERAAIFIALRATIQRCGLDTLLLADLLSAFRQDVLVKRYENWETLLDYCRRSANPVGRLVLAVAGYRDATMCALSDEVCTALQLTNFWQDLEIDWNKGRLYVPSSIMADCGATEAALEHRDLTPEWRQALREVVKRTRALFETGRGIADAVNGRLRWELRATWLGGMRILDKIERSGFDVFRQRPVLSWRDIGPIGFDAIFWRRHRDLDARKRSA
jgi:phytoene synthase